MREILFRGKAINRVDGREYRTNYKNGDWVYGLLTDMEKRYNTAEMTNEDGISGIDVDLKTLGQYTGFKDQNGTKIFEGDIFGDSSRREIDVVVFEDGCFQLKSYGYIEYCLDGNAYEERWSECDCQPICNFCLEHDEILGNIYDNPELLEGVC